MRFVAGQCFHNMASIFELHQDTKKTIEGRPLTETRRL